MKKRVIAIDGPAASGKGSLARKIAKELSYAHMDTGALYRAVAYELLNNGFSLKDHKDAVDAAQILRQKIEEARSPDEILDNPTLREDKIGQEASVVAAIPRVREELLDIQKNFAKDPGNGFKGAVLDGRDIGTVICPDADVKLFITADTAVRAKRRLKELQSKGIKSTYMAVLRDMRERDARDAERKAAPMKPAAGAVTLDTSHMTETQVFEKAMAVIQEKLAG